MIAVGRAESERITRWMVEQSGVVARLVCRQEENKRKSGIMCLEVNE